MAEANASRVLISGASGLIGSALVPSLEAGGYEVTRLVRGAASGERQIAWDPARPLAPELVSGFDAVIHLSGESIVGRWTEAKKKRIVESRVGATRTLSEALTKAPQRPRIFLCASAVGYYGDRGDEILREESASGEQFASELCRQWEAASQSAEAAGIRTAHMRLGAVLSAHGGALREMLTPFQLGLGGKIGNGRQWMPWIAIADVVGAMLWMLSHDLSGAVNVVSPNPVTNAEFAKTLASVLSRPAIFPVPAFAVRLAFGDMGKELLLASQRVEPAKLVASGYGFRQPDLRKALEGILKR
ncbi:MAG: TIGR01777 family oxidoreductase [Terriglobales bacterium]